MKKHHQEVSMLYMFFSMTFTMCLVAANLFATKQISWGIINFTGAIFVFPVSYIINDVVAEVWGFRRMRSLIWTAFAINFAFVLIATLVDIVPGANWWQTTDAGKGFHAIFGLAPRIVAASFLAFLVGSFVNAAVMSKMKVASNGKRFSLRAIVSTILGESCDSIIFFPIALAGIVPWSQMPYFVVCQVTLKTLYEIIILPLTTQIVKLVKKNEGVDVYDHDISYNIFIDKQ
ncbi:MAG: queuosine precursor transporter [Bacteroidales bacterium]|nr:queuosine precursor transporter [Bacteroidales bacterium]